MMNVGNVVPYIRYGYEPIKWHSTYMIYLQKYNDVKRNVKTKK